MRFLYDIPTPVLVLLLLGVMAGAVEGAQRLGQRFDGEIWQRSRDMFIATSGAMLALLGLLLAFCFNMSAARYDARGTLVLKEANTIVSTYRRADLLVPAAREQMRELLRQYAALRLQYFEVGHDQAEEGRVICESRVLQHGRIWPLAAVADNYLEPRAVGMSLLASAADEMITVSQERHASRANRVPEPVLWMLFVLAVLASATVGYCFGASAHGGRIFTLTFVFLVCLVIYAILDLDRPRRGLMKVDQTPVIELQSILRR